MKSKPGSCSACTTAVASPAAAPANLSRPTLPPAQPSEGESNVRPVVQNRAHHPTASPLPPTTWRGAERFPASGLSRAVRFSAALDRTPRIPRTLKDKPDGTTKTRYKLDCDEYRTHRARIGMPEGYEPVNRVRPQYYEHAREHPAIECFALIHNLPPFSRPNDQGQLRLRLASFPQPLTAPAQPSTGTSVRPHPGTSPTKRDPPPMTANRLHLVRG